MKALILAGGRGKRLDDLSARNNKCMIRVNSRPAIEYNLDNAAAGGVDEILIVVGYRAEEIINYLGTRYKGMRLRYVIQWEQQGLVHAIECAREALEGEDFLLLLGDEIMINPRHGAMVAEFRKGDVFALCGILKVDDKNLIRRTYTLIQDDGGRIHRLIEKPRNPFNFYQGTGNCVFRNAILDYIDVTPIHHERNEKELPDLIQCAIDEGRVVKSFNICDKYTNINTEEDIKMGELFFKKILAKK
jgi:dTDP-glucose pyrophosphorylase